MKKVSELEGAELDYFVAKAEGLNAFIEKHAIANPDPERNMCCLVQVDSSKEGSFRVNDKWLKPYQPHKDWSVGGPIIERESICWNKMIINYAPAYRAEIESAVPKNGLSLNMFYGFGSTQLIAAMRCYVASKFGEYAEE